MPPFVSPDMSIDRSVRLHFGSILVDLHTHELWKHGTRLKLSGQPFGILAILPANPSQLVTREYLRSQIWTSDTFVGFDHGLNAAMNKLRDTLSDSVDSPRYIETLPRRGYRFIASVESLSTTAPPVGARGHSILRRRDNANHFRSRQHPRTSAMVLRLAIHHLFLRPRQPSRTLACLRLHARRSRPTQ